MNFQLSQKAQCTNTKVYYVIYHCKGLSTHQGLWAIFRKSFKSAPDKNARVTRVQLLQLVQMYTGALKGGNLLSWCQRSPIKVLYMGSASYLLYSLTACF